MTIAAAASLVVGVVIGFVGQRSRMCFVAGIRDWIIVRDTFLLKGMIAFLLVGWIAFPFSAVLGGQPVGAFATPVLVTTLFAVIGGFGVGYFSILANGCPFRQHVLAGQGAGGAMVYLAGFVAGSFVFEWLFAPALLQILP